MRYLLAALSLAPLLMPPDAFAAEDRVLCLLEPSSIVSRSASGIAQVSNLGDIQIHCSVPAQPVSLKPGESLFDIGAKTAKAFLLLPGGDKKEVPVEVIGRGGGNNREGAYVDFYLHPPLDSPEREAEARRAVARLDREIAKDSSRPPEKTTEEQQRLKVATISTMVFQHRAGRFHVECYLTQGERSVGTGEIDFEVLYKGQFSDVWPFADPLK